MIWQSVMVVLLGCTLAGNTLTSAVSFPRPVARRPFDITDSEELLQALEFLEKYEGPRRSQYSNDIPALGGEDYPYLPYDAIPTQDRLIGNRLPPLTPYVQYDYPLEDDHIGNIGIDYPTGNIDRSLTIGDRMEQDWEAEQAINRLFEDAIMEEMLREDAAAAAELLEAVDDMEDERENEEAGEEDGFVPYSAGPEISNGVMDEASDAVMPSFVLDDDYSDQDTPPALESFADYSESMEEDDGIDEELVEAVIIKMAEDQMAKKLLEEEGLDDELDLSLEGGDGQETDAEIDNFVAGIMTELLDGSEDLADRLVAEIEEEKDMLEADDTLDQGEGDDLVDGIDFGVGWDNPEEKRGSKDEIEEDLTCPALDFLLDDCRIVDEFPGLGDGGYKGGFAEECNRHQLCYFCSGTFGIPKSLCDETYKVELMTICSGDDECSFRAKYFWLSALASRNTTPAELDVCSQPCVVAYLLDN